MKDFSDDIKKFKQYGTYQYKFDANGNNILNNSSENFYQVYVAFPLENVSLNERKINLFYNSQFEEFIPNNITSSTENQIISNTQQKIDILEAENSNLKTQLDSLISQNESSGSVANQMAIKQVIIELRKMLGQGRTDSDFSSTFPYTAILKKTSLSAITSSKQ